MLLVSKVPASGIFRARIPRPEINHLHEFSFDPLSGAWYLDGRNSPIHGVIELHSLRFPRVRNRDTEEPTRRRAPTGLLRIRAARVHSR